MADLILKNRVCLFGTTDIILYDNGPIFTGAQVLQFCSDPNLALQAVIPANRQSLGDTEGRHMYFKDTTHRIIDRGA